MTTDEPIPLLFRCDGGREDGLGHLSRCLALADALAEPAGRAPRFVTHGPDGAGERFIRRRGHACLLSPALAGSEADLDFMIELLNRTLEESGTRPLLVVDSRRVSADYLRTCAVWSFLACLDDEALRDLPCDLLVNSHLRVTAESYPQRARRKVLAGPDYNLIPEDLFEAGQRRAARDGAPLRVLVTLGGEDPHNHTAWVLEHLGDLLAGQRVTLVLGPAHPDPAATVELARRTLPEAEVLESPAGLASHIAAADLAITAGGITCTELAAARVAQLAIIVEEHQRPLVEALAARGCLVALGSHADLPAEPARQALARLLGSAEARQAQAAAAAALFPGSGLPRLAAEMIEAYRAA